MKSLPHYSTKDITTLGMMVAVIEVSKFALGALPNIELTTFWLMMFTLIFGRKVIIIIPVFTLLEGFLYGLNYWWLMYLYIWAILVFVTMIFRKKASAILFAVISGVFGLCFGGLCSLTYFVVGVLSGSVTGGIITAFSWWISGLPWDLVHGAANFIIMRVLFKPVSRVARRLFISGCEG